MPVRFQHDQLTNSVYFITFTCYKWKQLFRIAQAYDAVYKWFDTLYEKKISVFSYVIMPNHVHVLLHFPTMPKSLNTIIGTAKRFMAYEIIKNLEKSKETLLLEELYNRVSKRERKKKQRHKVFEESFDAKEMSVAGIYYAKVFPNGAANSATSCYTLRVQTITVTGQ